MNLSEQEIRQIIRKRIIAESQGSGVTAGDVGAAATATVGGVGALGTGLAVVQAGGVGAAATNTALTIGALYSGKSLTTAAVMGFGDAAAKTAAASGLFTVSSTTALETVFGTAIASNPLGWGIGATIAVGMAMGYIFLSKSDVGEEFVEILDGTLALKTAKAFAEIESATKAKLIEIGMEKEARDFPSLQHYNDIRGLHTQLAKEFYAAETDNHSLFGMGTDEKEIGKIIRKHPSLMDLSLTALAYKKLYAGKFNKYDSLIDMFEGELADEDSMFGYGNEMTDYVRGPIRELEKRAIICFNIGGGKKKCFSQSELDIFLKELDEGLKKAPDKIDQGEGQIMPIDPNGLKGSVTARIQLVMNKYSESRLIGEKISVDGKWGPQTDALWEKVLNHTFKSHTVFSTKEYAKMFKTGFYKWEEVSEKMVGEFPGYVSSRTGCLAFVTDAYNGDTAYGSGEKKISIVSGGGRSGGASGGAKSDKEIDQTGDEDLSGTMDATESLRPTISVILAGQGRSSLESLGYDSGTTSGLAAAIATRVKGNISGGTINLTVVVDRDGIVRNVRLAPGQRRSPVNKQFENLRNVVRRYLEKAGSADNNKIEPSRIRSKVRSKARKFELVLNFPAGRYN